MMPDTADLPEPVRLALSELIVGLERGLGPRLRSVLLFGSGAEGRLRPTSDVNVLVLLREFHGADADAIRGPVTLASAAVRVRAMFVLEEELAAAAEAFAVKFGDIHARHRVLFGTDPLAALTPSPAALKRRLQQVLLNLRLRLRERLVVDGGQDDVLIADLAENSGPIRVAAASLLRLRGDAAPAPREALERLAASLPGGPWNEVLAALVSVRQGAGLPPGAAGPMTERVLSLLQAMDRVLAATGARTT